MVWAVSIAYCSKCSQVNLISSQPSASIAPHFASFVCYLRLSVQRCDIRLTIHSFTRCHGVPQSSSMSLFLERRNVWHHVNISYIAYFHSVFSFVGLESKNISIFHLEYFRIENKGFGCEGRIQTSRQNRLNKIFYFRCALCMWERSVRLKWYLSIFISLSSTVVLVRLTKNQIHFRFCFHWLLWFRVRCNRLWHIQVLFRKKKNKRILFRFGNMKTQMKPHNFWYTACRWDMRMALASTHVQSNEISSMTWTNTIRIENTV